MSLPMITVDIPIAVIMPNRNNNKCPNRVGYLVIRSKWNSHAVNKKPTVNAVPTIITVVLIVMVTPFVEVGTTLRWHPL